MNNSQSKQSDVNNNNFIEKIKIYVDKLISNFNINKSYNIYDIKKFACGKLISYCEDCHY